MSFSLSLSLSLSLSQLQLKITNRAQRCKLDNAKKKAQQLWCKHEALVAKKEETLQTLGAMQMITILGTCLKRNKSRHKRRLAHRQGQKSKGTHNN
jgi:hypothetical protein